jgi:aminomethyltransferase
MASGDSLEKTPLHGLHVELGAKLVPFAGYEMPIQYPSGILQEHTHVRNGVGLFDVSHMGQVWLSGNESALALEKLVPGDIVGLAPFAQRYTILTNNQGGIIDDLMVTNAEDKLCIVVNAACKETDIALLQDHLSAHCTVEPQPDRALLALQGPEAAAVMARFSSDAASLVFMTAAWTEIAGAECFVTRSGYTGEDGFEISVATDNAEAVVRALLDEPEVAPIGLGARDSLRLEAGLCLYGQDIDTTTSPIEAALTWVVAKSRRADGARPGGFPGAEVIFDHIANGIARKRVGIRPEGRAPVRTGTVLTDPDGRSVGVVTSGGYGPTVGAPVAMGYVETDLAKPGTALTAMVRGKPLPVIVSKQSFVPHRYYRG